MSDKNEITGSHSIAPSHTAGTFSIDARTMVMAALFLVGGAGTGAGTSMLGGSGVKEAVEKLETKIDKLVVDIDAMKARASVDDFYRKMVDDHEKRLDALERGER